MFVRNICELCRDFEHVTKYIIAGNIVMTTQILYKKLVYFFIYNLLSPFSANFLAVVRHCTGDHCRNGATDFNNLEGKQTRKVVCV